MKFKPFLALNFAKFNLTQVVLNAFGFKPPINQHLIVAAISQLGLSIFCFLISEDKIKLNNLLNYFEYKLKPDYIEQTCALNLKLININYLLSGIRLRN
jgi:hypothetical protein